MDPHREFMHGESFIDPDTATINALRILEHPFPTPFDTFPSDDPKLNILVEIGGGDFAHDLASSRRSPSTSRVGSKATGSHGPRRGSRRPAPRRSAPPALSGSPRSARVATRAKFQIADFAP